MVFYIITRQLKRRLAIFLGEPARRTPREKTLRVFSGVCGGPEFCCVLFLEEKEGKHTKKGAGEKRGHFGTDSLRHTGISGAGKDNMVALLRHDSKLFISN